MPAPAPLPTVPLNPNSSYGANALYPTGDNANYGANPLNKLGSAPVPANKPVPVAPTLPPKAPVGAPVTPSATIPTQGGDFIAPAKGPLLTYTPGSANDPNNKTIVTNPTGPSSSATMALNSQANSAIGSITAPNPPQAPLSEAQQWAMQNYGWTEQQTRDKFGNDEMGIALTNTYNENKLANDQAVKERTASDAKYAAEQANQDAQWAIRMSEIDRQKKGAIDSMNATNYANNPYAATGSNSSNGAASNTQVVEDTYNAITAKAKQQYDYATSLITNGQVDAGNTILANLDKELAANADKIGAAQKSVNEQSIQTAGQQEHVAEAAATLAETTKSREATLQANTENRAATLYQAALTKLPQGVNLPGGQGFDTYNQDFNSLTEKQKATVQGQEAWQEGKNSGLSDQAVWNGIQNAATSAFAQQKIDNAQSNAQARLLLAQETSARNQAKYYASLTSSEDFKNSVLFSSQGIPYVNSGDYKGTTAFNSARQQANASGTAFLSPAESTQIKGITSALSQNKSMFDQISGYLKANNTTWENALTNTPTRVLSTWSKADPILSAFGSWWSTSIATLKASAGSSNFRITQTEINNEMEKNQVTTSDTVASANQKMINIQTMLHNTENAILGKTSINSKNDLNSGTMTPPVNGSTQIYKGISYRFDSTKNSWVKR